MWGMCRKGHIHGKCGRKTPSNRAVAIEPVARSYTLAGGIIASMAIDFSIEYHRLTTLPLQHAIISMFDGDSRKLAWVRRQSRVLRSIGRWLG